MVQAKFFSFCAAFGFCRKKTCSYSEISCGSGTISANSQKYQSWVRTVITKLIFWISVWFGPFVEHLLSPLSLPLSSQRRAFVYEVFGPGTFRVTVRCRRHVAPLCWSVASSWLWAHSPGCLLMTAFVKPTARLFLGLRRKQADSSSQIGFGTMFFPPRAGALTVRGIRAARAGDGREGTERQKEREDGGNDGGCEGG